MATPASAGGRDARVASHSAFFQRGDARVASGAGFLDDKGFANETQGGEWVNIGAQLYEPDGGEKTAASEVSISDSNTSTCLKHLRRVAAEGERLAQGPGGRFFNGIRLEDFRTNLRQAANALAATRPSHRCGKCDGTGCQHCDQAGWLCPGKQRLY